MSLTLANMMQLKHASQLKLKYIIYQVDIYQYKCCLEKLPVQILLHAQCVKAYICFY